METYSEIALSHNLMQFRQKPNLTAFYRALFQPFDDLQKAFLQLKLERGIDQKVKITRHSPYLYRYFGFKGSRYARGFNQSTLVTAAQLLTDKSSHKTIEESFNLFSIDLAIGKQLDGIGDILGILRPYITDDNQIFFGFRGQSRVDSFSKAILRSESEAWGSSKLNLTPLSDSAYKRLLRWKIVANNAHGTINDIIDGCVAVFYASKVEVIEQTKNRHLTINVEISNSNRNPFIESIKDQFILAPAGISFSINIR